MIGASSCRIPCQLRVVGHSDTWRGSDGAIWRRFVFHCSKLGAESGSSADNPCRFQCQLESHHVYGGDVRGPV
jgi:hypothetical protein